MGNIKSLIERTELELESLEKSPFTKEGFNSYKNNISEFILDLLSESARVSKRNNSDLISAVEVDNASRNIKNKSRKKLNVLLNTIGGIFLGYSVTSTVNIYSFGITYKPVTIIAILTSGIIGAFLLSYVFFSKE